MAEFSRRGMLGSFIGGAAGLLTAKLSTAAAPASQAVTVGNDHLSAQETLTDNWAKEFMEWGKQAVPCFEKLAQITRHVAYLPPGAKPPACRVYNLIGDSLRELPQSPLTPLLEMIEARDPDWPMLAESFVWEVTELTVSDELQLKPVWRIKRDETAAPSETKIIRSTTPRFVADKAELGDRGLAVMLGSIVLSCSSAILQLLDPSIESGEEPGPDREYTLPELQINELNSPELELSASCLVRTLRHPPVPGREQFAGFADKSFGHS